MIIPPYLKKGSTIGITCPAGYMPYAKAETCIHTLQQWGFAVMTGKTLGSESDNYFSGTDEARANELQAMLDSESIDAILCGRGGYGIGRIIDRLNFKQFRKRPKWIIGYSDITLLHIHLNRVVKTASLHSPMAAAFNDGTDNDYILSLRKAITGKKQVYAAPPHALNHTGTATGELVGGNLALLCNSIGTPSAPDTTNKILFIEDIGEYVYSIDRMMYQLERSGKLDRLAGLIIGHFTDTKDTERPFGKTAYETIAELLRYKNYPVCFGFPVGHETSNYALKCGVVHTLSISQRSVKLREE